MRRIIIVFLGVALLIVVACSDDYYDYHAYSYIDTVLAADTISNDELVRIVYWYPSGCNQFERIESSERGDTLELAALFHFYFKGEPCAHGSGYDTTSHFFHVSAPGPWYLKYRRGEETWIAQFVHVRE